MEVAKIQVGGTCACAYEKKTIRAGMVGVTVSFAFDEYWDGLNKIAVYRCGGVARDEYLEGDTGTIPAEVLTKSGFDLEVGVYGTDAEKQIAIPTCWANLGVVRPGADPSGDPAADPSLPIWAQILAKLGNLADLNTEAKENLVAAINEVLTKGGGEVDPEEIGRIVDEYLKKNPPAAYTLPIATETTLGGVKAAAATEEMTQPVGITAEGKLVTVPGQNSGGNVELDTTLTQSGKAADAKAVGDKIAEITGISLVEPADDDIPKVFFSGDITGMSKDNEKVIQFAYKSRNADFGGYVKMKWQGSSTLAFPKKNFTIKMFTDETCESKLKKAFKDWGYEKNKYVLKADYVDHTHARNIVTANLWTEMVASRPDFDSLPEGMKNAPGHGAIDGFPIKLYLNGVYQGIYTWTIGKDDWMFGMDESNANNAAICAEKNNNGDTSTTDRNILACEFRGNANINGSDWDLEFPETLNNSIKTSFNNLINCVKDTDDATFKATIGNYLDLTSAFDYYILAYLSANVDGLGKNLIMMTYDGVKWFCSAYDMDDIWGSRGTSSFVNADLPCPENYYENNSLLWQRIESCFGVELYARYKEVRKKVLSFENVITKFERFCDMIGSELYAEDVEIYPGIPQASANNLKQIRNFFTPRAEYVDACMYEIGTPMVSVPCTGITLSASELTFTEKGSQTITATVTPDGCTDAIRWESNNTSVAMVVGGVVTAIANGSAIITAKCGSYSASCSVAVSGIVEPVPCTGITLSADALTFDGEGTQTITATVTPADTTDSVVWVSSAPAVASIVVDGNVCTVQSVSNGEATITVTCGGYSANCTVTVSGIVDTTLVYSLPEETAFNGTSYYINTGIKLWENDIDFTVALDVTPIPTGAEVTVFSLNKPSIPYQGINMSMHPSKGTIIYVYSTSLNPQTATLSIPSTTADNFKVIITHASGSGTYNIVYLFDGTIATGTIKNGFNATDAGFAIGAGDAETTPKRFLKGTVHDFRIYNRVLTDDEISAYLT